MDEYESLRHAKWECKYEVVSVPKHRGKVLYAGFPRRLTAECQIEQEHLTPEHVRGSASRNSRFERLTP